jgi:type IV pilus assembly protein PilQ
VALKLDNHPGYVISESGDGSIIELTLRDTRLSEDINQIEPRGLVRSSVALTDGVDVKIQFLLAEVGRANIVPVDDGFRVEITPAAQASSETYAASTVGVSNESPGKLTGVRYSRISANRIQIDLAMEGTLTDPAVFRTVAPPRIAFDFYGATNATGKTVIPVGISSLDRIVVVEDDNRMRLVLNLLDPVDYNLIRVDSGYILTIGTNVETIVSTPKESQEVSPKSVRQVEEVRTHAIKSVDFRRTPSGGGRIIMQLSDSEVAVDLQQLGSEIVAIFTDTSIPAELEQRLDVIDFATPVSFIDTYEDGLHVKLIVTTDGRFKQSSVQSGSTLVLDISPLTEAEIEAENVDEFGYKGERLSLNFQRISVRAALQVIADFTGLNFVTSDAITGNLSLKLKDVPWDQALDVILQTKGLAMRQKGNVVWVAPAKEITAKERQALTSQQEKRDLEPLVSELIRVSYAKVEDLAKLLKSIKAVDTGISQSAFGSVTISEIKTEENSLLSPRGSVTVDKRTNSILIQDTASKLKEIKAVIAKLDIPVRQVLIETRIVEANDDFSRNIGARLGFTRITQQARFPGASDSNIGDVFGSGTLDQTNQIRSTQNTDFSDDALSVNLPAGGIGSDLPGSYAFTIAKLGSGFLSLLDLEISALEAEGKGKILANPKIMTTDKRAAKIEQGQERLTTFGSAFGTAATEGQKAVLSLEVLPQITPDDKIILDVIITNDSFVAANTNTVNTKRINTQVLLENGETVVIGGIFTQDETYSITKVPILGDIPFIGNFFKKRTTRNNRSELLVFLTPRIIDPALAVQ